MKSFLIAPFYFLMVGCALTQVEESNINEPLTGGIATAAGTAGDAVIPERKATELELSDQISVVTDQEGIYLPKYLTDYRYLKQPNNTATEVSVWITRDNSHRFHVPWHIGGSWFDDSSEKIIVDPVNKTVSIGFEQVISNKEGCNEDQRAADRSVHGYFVCNSLFTDFKLIKVNKIKESETHSLKESANSASGSPSFWQKISSLFGVNTLTENEVLNIDKDATLENSKPPAEVVAEIARYDVAINLEQLALTVTQLNLLSKAERKLSGDVEPLDKLESRLLSKVNAAKRFYEKSLKVIQRNRIEDYVLATENETLKIKQQLFDKSGYYSYDITWPVAVSLAPLPIETKKFIYTPFVQEFKKYKVSDASEALASLTLSKMKRQYRKDRSEVARYLDESTGQYRVNCDFPSVIGDYRVSVQCPEFVNAAKGGVSVNLVYEVLAKRFDQVIPRYTNHNSDLTIIADSQTLSLTNNSDGDLKINGIEWLANDAAQSITRHTDKAKVFSIAQGQSVKISLNDSIGDDLKKELEIPYLSRRKALRKYLNYGFDVSYQVLEDNQTQSSEASRLHQTNRYSLNELLLSR
jgi:hypothetical protein